MTIDRKKLDPIVARVPLLAGRGEEATKQALILPMLDMLGYDIWNPAEVCPEFDADFATKKLGQKEKVDLALLLDSVPRVYLEAKAVDVALDGHEGQLARYFNATPSVSLGILTNGVEYRFFTDTEQSNIMDPVPFYTFRVDTFDPSMEVLTRFHRANLSAQGIRDYATELKWTSKIVAFLRDQLDLRDREPSEALTRWILSSDGIYDGLKNATVVNRFKPIVRTSLQLVLRDIVRRSVAALDEGVRAPAPAPVEPDPTPVPTPAVTETVDADTTGKVDPRVNTTERELAAFEIIKGQFVTSALSKHLVFDASLRRDVPLEIAYKDTQTYFSVYFNKPAWWFARLGLEGKVQWLAVNLPPEKAQEHIPSGFVVLSSYQWAPTRIQIRGPEDVHSLNRVLFAAMQACIA